MTKFLNTKVYNKKEVEIMEEKDEDKNVKEILEIVRSNYY